MKPPKPNEHRVLLLTSYCTDHKECTNLRPCNKCLSMCNTFNIPQDTVNIKDNYSGELGEEL